MAEAFRYLFLRPAYRIVLPLAVFACLALLSEAALAGENTWAAGIGASIEYNDNIDNVAHNQKNDIINHIKPQLEFTREGGRLYAQVRYRGDYQFYTKGNDADDYSHFLNAWAMGEIVENLFFLRIEEDLQPVHFDSTAGDVLEGDSLRNLVNRNRTTIAPSFNLQPTDRTLINFGYTFVDTRHSKSGASARRKPWPDGSDSYSFTSKKSQNHTVHVLSNHEVTDRFALTRGGDMTRRKSDSEAAGDVGADLYRYQVYAGFTYEVSEDLNISIQAGPSYTKPDDMSSSTNMFLNGSIDYTVGRTLFSLTYDTTYEDDAQTGNSLRHTNLGLGMVRTFDRASLGLGITYNTYESETSDPIGGGIGKSNIDVYRPYANLTYELSDRLRFFSSYNANYYKNASDGTRFYTIRYGLRYELDEDAWVSLHHRHQTSSTYSSINYSQNSINCEFYYGF